MDENRIPELIHQLSELAAREYAYADMEPDPISSSSWKRGEVLSVAAVDLEAAHVRIATLEAYVEDDKSFIETLQARIAALTEERDRLFLESQRWHGEFNLAEQRAEAAVQLSWIEKQRAERYRVALEAEHKARKEAQRCVGSLPIEMGQWFENRMAEADRSTTRTLEYPVAYPDTAEDDENLLLEAGVISDPDAWPGDRR